MATDPDHLVPNQPGRTVSNTRDAKVDGVDNTRAKPKVLVMDDEPVIANSMAQILTLFGYEAISVYNPTQAMQLVCSDRYDAVISDVVMDGYMSGIDFAIQLKTLLPECRVLLMSGNNSTAELLRVAEQQGHTFHVLPKPVDPNDILQRLKNMLA